MNLPNKKRPNITSMQISKDGINRLKEIGKKRDTYEDIIDRLLEFYMANGGKK